MEYRAHLTYGNLYLQLVREELIIQGAGLQRAEMSIVFMCYIHFSSLSATIIEISSFIVSVG